MGLTQRNQVPKSPGRKSGDEDSPSKALRSNPPSNGNDANRKEDPFLVAKVLYFVLILWIAFMGGFNFSTKKIDPASTNTALRQISLAELPQMEQGRLHDGFEFRQSTNSAESFAVHVFLGGATLSSEDIAVVTSVGPHTVQVIATEGYPKIPPVLTIQGAARIPIPLYLMSEKGSFHWTGSFTLPLMDAQTYQLESNLPECIENRGRHCQPKRSKPIQFTTKMDTNRPIPSATTVPQWSDSESLFPLNNPQWIDIHSVPARTVSFTPSQNAPSQQYIWGHPQSLTPESYPPDPTNKWTDMTLNQVTSKAWVQSVVSDPITFDKFRELSNYEIVCWMGGTSAQTLYDAFLSVRQDLFPGQRPFKFHYHPMKRLEQPDELWDDDLKTKFRKCKQIFISLDDPVFFQNSIGEPLSAQEYQSKLEIFLSHLVKAFPDPTFPIWMLSLYEESPLKAQTETHHCYGIQPKHSLEHPCNRAVLDLFDNKAVIWGKDNENRIRYLDNSNLSMGLAMDNSSHGPRLIDVVAIIVLRLFVVMGRQVAEWRDNHQKGAADGLHRNGSVEPNEDLVQYVWN